MKKRERDPEREIGLRLVREIRKIRNGGPRKMTERQGEALDKVIDKHSKRLRAVQQERDR